MTGPLQLLEQWLNGNIDGARVLDDAHYALHDGRAFSVSALPADLANNAARTVALLVADIPAHLGLRGICAGDAIGLLYEDPQFSATGTFFVPIQMNRDSGREPTVQAWLDPTISVSGTYILSRQIPGGTGGSVTGGDATTDLEVVLKPGKWYVAPMVNISGQARLSQVVAEWYEQNIKIPIHGGY